VITDFNLAEDDYIVLDHVLDLTDPNVKVGTSDDGDVMIKFLGSGATIEINGLQNQGFDNLTQLDAAISLTVNP
jgi:hypothetical protein